MTYEVINATHMLGHEPKRGFEAEAPKYPFDSLVEIGQGFYVPVKGGLGDQAKASTAANIANTVSRRNKRERKADTGKKFAWRLYDPNWLIVWRSA